MSYDSRPETFAHIDVVRGLLNEVIKDLIDRAHAHDQSKLVPPEVEMFDEITPRLRETTYGSEEYKETLKEMGPALQHHYQANQGHHPDAVPRGIRGMSLVDLLEMAIDWAAASQRHADGDLRRSVEINQERFRYSDELRDVLLNTYVAMGLVD